MVARTLNNALNEQAGSHSGSNAKAFLPGMAGGVARVMIGQPFDVIKTHMQVFPSDGATDAMRKVGGLRGLYTGVSAPLLGNVALLGVHFPTFQHFHKQQHWSVYASGAMAGAFGSLISCPMELLRNKMQAQRRMLMQLNKSNPQPHFTSTLDCAIKTIRANGPQALYKGYTPTLLRDMHGYGSFFFGYEYASAYTKTNMPWCPPPLQVMLSGIISGFCLWGSMFPIDTIKSKMQADEAKVYKNMLDCARQTLNKEGIQGLYRGFTPVLLRAVPVNAGIFIAVEGTRELIA